MELDELQRAGFGFVVELSRRSVCFMKPYPQSIPEDHEVFVKSHVAWDLYRKHFENVHDMTYQTMKMCRNKHPQAVLLVNLLSSVKEKSNNMDNSLIIESMEFDVDIDVDNVMSSNPLVMETVIEESADSDVGEPLLNSTAIAGHSRWHRESNFSFLKGFRHYDHSEHEVFFKRFHLF